MKPPIHNQPEAERRKRQRDIGLDIQPPPKTERRNDIMETNTQPQQPRRPHQQSRSEANMEYFALRVTTPPTYKQVAIHEIKRASVYAPIIFTTVVSALWASRKIILSMPAVP